MFAILATLYPESESAPVFEVLLTLNRVGIFLFLFLSCDSGESQELYDLRSEYGQRKRALTFCNSTFNTIGVSVPPRKLVLI